jgi:hypothetical protein
MDGFAKFEILAGSNKTNRCLITYFICVTERRIHIKGYETGGVDYSLIVNFNLVLKVEDVSQIFLCRTKAQG